MGLNHVEDVVVHHARVNLSTPQPLLMVAHELYIFTFERRQWRKDRMYGGNRNCLPVICGITKINQAITPILVIGFLEKFHGLVDTPSLQWHGWIIETPLMAIRGLEITID